MVAISQVSHDETQRLAALYRYDILDTPAEEAFERLVKLVARTLGVPMACICLAGQDRHWIKAAYGLAPGTSTNDHALCNFTLLSPQPVIVYDTAADPRFTDNIQVTGTPFIRFYAGVPLRTHDNYNLGTLCIFDCQPRLLSAADIATLQDMAALIMDQLELRQEKNARSKAEEDQRHQNAYRALMHETALALGSGLKITDLLTTIVQRAHMLLGTTQAFLYLREPDDDVMEVRIGVGYQIGHTFTPVHPGEGMAGCVWQAGHTLTVNNYATWAKRLPDPAYDWMHAMVGVPLICDNDVLGVLGMIYEDSEKTFSAADVDVVTRFAELASIALQNARLYETSQRRLAEVETLQRVGQLINSKVRLHEVFQTVVNQLSSAFGFKKVSIYLREGDGLTLQAYTGYQHVFSFLRLDQGVIGRVSRTGVGAFVRDASQDPDFLFVDENVRQSIVIPLKTKDGQVGGVINVEVTDTPRLHEDDFQVLQLLADQVSVAIENARLFDELQRSETKYRDVVNSVQEIIFQIDTKGEWSFLNQAWEDLLGYTVAESLGTFCGSHINPDDYAQLDKATQKVMARQTDEIRHDIRILTKDGQIRWMSVHAHLRVAADGTILGAAGTLTDISDLRQAMQDTLAAQAEVEVLTKANALKTKFMAVVSHELRTPLTGILGFAELLTMQNLTPEMVKSYGAKIVLSAERIKAMIDEYLNLQRMEAGAEEFNFRAVDLTALVTEVSAMVDPLQHPLELHLAPVPHIRADRVKLRRVIENLLSNAVKYSPEGQPICVSLDESGEDVQLNVRDHGIGIASDSQHRIFEKFYRGRSVTPANSQPGTGLGLAISKEIVERHGGSIGFQSNDNGTTFWVLLPAAKNVESSHSSPNST